MNTDTLVLVCGLAVNILTILGAAVHVTKAFTKVEESSKAAHNRLDSQQAILAKVQDGMAEIAKIQERTLTLIDKIQEDIHAPEVGLRSRVHGLFNREIEKGELFGGLKAQMDALEKRLDAR